MARARTGDSIAAMLLIMGIFFLEMDYLLAGIALLGAAGCWIYKTQKVWLLAIYITVVGLFLFLILSGITAIGVEILMILVPIIFAWDSLLIYRTERRMKKVMKNLRAKDFEVEVIPGTVPSYYLKVYSLKSPYLVRVICREDVVKGFYDTRTNVWVARESESFPVYTSTPEKIWKTVVSTHPDGTIHRIECKDRFEFLVGVEVYNEAGTRTDLSWRLHRDLYETWDTASQEWKTRRRGWHPPGLFMYKVTAFLGLS
ncbi:MAG: hypothetical protein HXS52_01455 [Theionarchaea archaeon]|nr:hypothetical protein [Theionarchaea archaeon]MBU7036569.1 hypothetical protein [Theionarchaea archaeon]